MKKTIIAILSGIIVLLGGYTVSNFGSVTTGNEYKYYPYTGTVASTTLIKSGPTALGSVIITEDTAAVIEIYDCATTSAELVASTTFSTLVSRLQTALTEGVYTFDVQLDRGLVVSSSLVDLAGDLVFT